MAERIEMAVTVKGAYSYEAPAYGYGTETRYIYTMTDDNGTVYVWKTTTHMYEKILDPVNGWDIDKQGRKWSYRSVNRGDRVVVAATIKGQSEYKGEPQTEVTRVKVKETLYKAPTPEEIREQKEAERQQRVEAQLNSITGEDFIWTMPYKQYKEHYNDCETVEGSFKRHKSGVSTIEVIIREGRLKASGVRGQHYSGYEFKFMINGERHIITYRAVKEENALRRLQKDFPDATDIEAGKIYNYDSHRVW